MEDNHKTKVQFMNESEELRQRITELETKRKQAQEKLKKYRGNLEDLIEERSAELKRIHKQLKRKITKRKQAEKMLRDNEEKYRELINTSVDGVISADTHMKITLWNPGAERIFGYTEEETLGQSLMKIVPERYRNAMEKGFVEFQKNGSGPFIGKTLELESVRKDGTEVPIELSISSRSVGATYIATAVVRDITERKRAEEQLQESEQRFRSLFEGVPIGLYRSTQEGKRIDGNPAMVDMLGYPNLEAFLEDNIADSYADPGDRRRWQAKMEREGVVRGFDVQMRRQDGQAIWVQESARAVRDSKGRILYYQGAVEDITKIKKLAIERERILHSLEERVKELSCLYGIDKICRREGITIEELLKEVVNLIPPSWQYPEITGGRITFEGKKYKTRNFKETKWMQRADILVNNKKAGLIEVCYLEEKPESDEGPFLKEERNLINAVAERLRQFIERKQAEEELKSSEERLRILFEYAPDAYYLNDLKANFINGNKAAEKITGYKRKELVGKNFLKLKLLSPAEIPKAAASLAKNALGKATGPDEFVLNRKDGSQVPVEIRTFPVKIKDKTLVLGIARDITKHKNAEAIRDVLFNISNATTETGSLDDLLATIHKQVETLMDAKNFFCCLAYDTEKNLYTFPYYKDINPEDVVEPDEIHEITEGLTHHVLKTKKYLLGNKQELKKIGVIGTVPESWLGVPLKTEGGDVDGVVAVQSYEKEAYSEKDAQVLSIIASNITGALKYKKTEEQIKASLKEKEVLLREIHHRVKNNLQVVSSLLKLQSQHIEDKRYVEMFKDSQDRIRSMSLIHEMLYQSKQLSKINFKEYIRTLTNYLLRSCWPSPRKIVLKIDSENVYLPVDNAIPCGLIINELVSNSLKHAFPDGKKGQIKIGLHSINEEDIELVVSDDGVGIPEDLDFRNTKSLGLHLVVILAEDQLHGQIKLDRKKGTEFQIKLRGVK